MKANIVALALLGAVLAWMALPQPSRGQAEAYEVTMTAYTCEASPRNPMYPCGPLRWGGDRYAPGMACPYEWRNRRFEVPGYGILRCDDTPRDGYLNGRPHIDVRVSTVAEALQIGYRRETIWAVDPPPSAPVAPAPEPAPPATTTVLSPDAAIALAANVAPQGDRATAMARLLRVDTARHHFPTLVESVTLAGDQPLWVVTIWVPEGAIPAGSVAKPNADAPVAAQFLVFDVRSGALLVNQWASSDVVETMGWIPSDNIPLGQ